MSPSSSESYLSLLIDFYKSHLNSLQVHITQEAASAAFLDLDVTPVTGCSKQDLTSENFLLTLTEAIYLMKLSTTMPNHFQNDSFSGTQTISRDTPSPTFRVHAIKSSTACRQFYIALGKGKLPAICVLFHMPHLRMILDGHNPCLPYVQSLIFPPSSPL